MKDIILLTRPSHDEPVSYLFYWGQQIISFAGKLGVRFHDLPREKANKKEVESFVNSMKPTLIIFHGHGSADAICGHKDQPLIVAGENESLLRGRITYAVACESAASLGEKVAQNGNSTFIGYTGPFGFVRDATRSTNPVKDKYAIPFQEMSNLISIELLRGKTAKEAHEKSQQRCVELIKEYGTSDADPVNKEIRFWLFWDMQFQKLLGDENKRLEM